MKNFTRKLAIALIVIGAINCLTFFIGISILGGDAMNGKVENGRYFVANHGKYTEVSKAAWLYSKCHGVSVWITHPLLIVGGILAVLPGVRKRMEERRLKTLSK